MPHINLTPSWSSILPLWKRVMSNCTKLDTSSIYGRSPLEKRQRAEKSVADFWQEMDKMAEAASNYNSLVRCLTEEGWDDERIKLSLEEGRALEEADRQVIHEDDDNG